MSYRRNYWGTILKRYGTVEAIPSLPGRNKGDPAQITYKFAADELATDAATGISLVGDNHLPRIRIANGGKIVVAEPGHPCVISIRSGPDGVPHLYLFPFTEGIPFREACP